MWGEIIILEKPSGSAIGIGAIWKGVWVKREVSSVVLLAGNPFLDLVGIIDIVITQIDAGDSAWSVLDPLLFINMREHQAEKWAF